ncbi:hypothetical protein Tco_1295268 [Tanacetum coccineum]
MQTDHLNQVGNKDFVKTFKRCEPIAYRRELLENLDTLEVVIHKVVNTYVVLRMKENELNTLKENGKSSGTKPDKQDTSSSSGNYTTQAVDADIGPVNDEEPFAEVQLTALHNILANEQQHTEQSEPKDARKMTQDKTRIPSHKDMPSTRAHRTPNACTPKPRNIYRSSPFPQDQKQQSVEPKNHTINLVIPTGKMFTDSTTKVDSEPPNGSNDDITNPYECNQTLYVSGWNSNLMNIPSNDVMVQNNSSLVLSSNESVSHHSGLCNPFREKESVRVSAFILDNEKRNLFDTMAKRIFPAPELLMRLTDPSLLRTVTYWKGKPSLRSTEVVEESYLPHFS